MCPTLPTFCVARGPLRCFPVCFSQHTCLPCSAGVAITRFILHEKATIMKRHAGARGGFNKIGWIECVNLLTARCQSYAQRMQE